MAKTNKSKQKTAKIYSSLTNSYYEIKVGSASNARKTTLFEQWANQKKQQASSI